MKKEPLSMFERLMSAAGGAVAGWKNEAGQQVGVDNEIAVLARGNYKFDEYSNLDDLVKRKGLSVYDEMMTDAQIRMAVNYKRFAVISSDWDVQAASNSEGDCEVADFVKFSLEQMRGSVVQAVFGIMNALVHGYSISEMVFRPVEGGEHKGRWILERIKPKHPEDYEFTFDDFGNLSGLWNKRPEGQSVEMPIWKFVVYTYLPEYGRPWGKSDLRAVYKHWWSKDFLIKWWNIYLETFGAPTRVGKYPAAATSPSRQDDLKKVLRDIVNNTAITIPDDMNIEFITASGQAGFDAAIEYHDSQIVKGILGQTLTSGEGSRVGSMALGNVHQETMEDYVTFLRRDVAESAIQEQIIRCIVDLNFGEQASYPKFVWQPRKGKIEITSVSDIATLMDSGVANKNDIDTLRGQLGLGPIEEVSEQLWKGNRPQASGSSNDNSNGL